MSGLLDAALGAAELVEPGNLVQDKVDKSQHNSDSKAVCPDADDRDDIGVAVMRLGTRYPAKEREDGGENVDGEDSADELPTRPSASATSDKDEPVLGAVRRGHA